MALFVRALNSSPAPAGLLRRLGAILSDALVLFGLLALTTLFVFVPVLNAMGKKAMVPSEVGWGLSILYVISLLGVCLGFYGYFWTRSGQTIGMRAWRLSLVTLDGGLLGWKQAVQRWLVAVAPWVFCLLLLNLAESLTSFEIKILAVGVGMLGGLDFISMFGRADRLCWHDRMSSSRLILLPER